MVHSLLLDGPFRDRGFSNFANTSSRPRHRWFYFKEGFSASLVNAALRDSAALKKNIGKLRILDPFCGTGTTSLAAGLRGHHCTSIEVNPFLHFAARTKSYPKRIYSGTFLDRLERISSFSSHGLPSHLEEFSTFTSRSGSDKWLYNKSVLRRFTRVKEVISNEGGSYRDLFSLAAIAAAGDCCNAKRDGKALRYKPDWKSALLSGEYFLQRFRCRSRQILSDIQRCPMPGLSTQDFIRGDSRHQLKFLKNESYDLVVTSPPYLNSFDYSDVYRPELFLGEFVSDNEELRKIRLQTLRSHVQVDWPRDADPPTQMLDPILKKLGESPRLWSPRIPAMVSAYFDDLAKVLAEVYKKLRKGGSAWIVVSTSAYAGIHIPVDLIIADMAANLSFKLEGVHCMRMLRTAGQQNKQLAEPGLPLRESLVIIGK